MMRRSVLIGASSIVINAVVMLSHPVATLSNDSSFGRSGSPYPHPTPNPYIQMLSEVIDVQIMRSKARVTCLFILRNEGPRHSVRIGFPDEAYGDVSEKGRIFLFTSSVNGKPIHVRRVPVKPSTDSGGIYAWWMKDVIFEAGETKTVRNTYEISLSTQIAMIPNPAGGWLLGNVVSFSYILRTGAPWKGPIGEATVTVDLGPVNYRDIIGLGTPPRVSEDRAHRIRPASVQRIGRKLRWHFRNFEPTEKHDIQVAWYELVPQPASAQRICPACSLRPLTEAELQGKSTRELTLMRNEIYAVHGRSFNRKELREYFSRQPWYKPNPNYHEGLLSSIERKNAAFILAYQRKHGLMS